MTLDGRKLTAVGGADYARDALTLSMGEERAQEILSRMNRGELHSPSFSALDALEPTVIRDILRDEHPQTVSVVLAHLSSSQAAKSQRRWRSLRFERAPPTRLPTPRPSMNAVTTTVTDVESMP